MVKFVERIFCEFKSYIVNLVRISPRVSAVWFTR